MIVFDTSTLVGAAAFPHTPPFRAFDVAVNRDIPVLSIAVYAEIEEVLFRPRLARFVDPALRSLILDLLHERAVWIEPKIAVTDCRDLKDNKVLELALAARASTIVSSDNDLLVLHPWRGVRILRPAEYLTSQGA